MGVTLFAERHHTNWGTPFLYKFGYILLEESVHEYCHEVHRECRC
jgi:hypothetical protein